MVPVTIGTQEILTFRAPGGRQFRFVVMITDVATLCCCCCHVNVSERDLEHIDAAFEKMKSDITNNITEIDQQKRKCLSDI
jgi:hypothetical protein